MRSVSDFISSRMKQISLDEAYRFLSHRWREKQLNSKKKKNENDGGHEMEGDAETNVGLKGIAAGVQSTRKKFSKNKNKNKTR